MVRSRKSLRWKSDCNGSLASPSRTTKLSRLATGSCHFLRHRDRVRENQRIGVRVPASYPILGPFAALIFFNLESF